MGKDLRVRGVNSINLNDFFDQVIFASSLVEDSLSVSLCVDSLLAVFFNKENSPRLKYILDAVYKETSGGRISSVKDELNVFKEGGWLKFPSECRTVTLLPNISALPIIARTYGQSVLALMETAKGLNVLPSYLRALNRFRHHSCVHQFNTNLS